MQQCVKLLASILTLFTLSLLGLVGCASDGPTPPPEWQSRQSVTTAEPADFDNSPSSLQVLICQGQVDGTHTGMRVVRPSRQIIFWDPAGQFGWGRDDLKRSRDVISENAPSLAEYVKWRFHGANDSAVALFEWRLSPERADYFADVLTHKAAAPEGETEFETSTVGLFCCHAVCAFLDRYAKDMMTIPTYWFRPEHLGDHLWSQHPDRVAIFHQDGAIDVFIGAPH